jgi:hypothetical protein
MTQSASWTRLESAVRATAGLVTVRNAALVTATGIISQAMRLDGAVSLSGFLLGAGIVAHVLLVVAYGWRLAGYRREFLADAADPRRAFAFFTFAATSDVLAARLAGDGHSAAAAVLMVAGGARWPTSRGCGAWCSRSARTASPAGNSVPP